MSGLPDRTPGPMAPSPSPSVVIGRRGRDHSGAAAAQDSLEEMLVRTRGVRWALESARSGRRLPLRFEFAAESALFAAQGLANGVSGRGMGPRQVSIASGGGAGANAGGRDVAGRQPARGSLVRSARYRCGVSSMGIVEWMPVLGPRVGVLTQQQPLFGTVGA